MAWPQQFFKSSIGGKFAVALTGLALVLFLVAHLAGNLLIFAGPEALAAYAEGLRRFPALLWGMRVGLLVVAVVHVTLAIKLNLASKSARPVAYASKVYTKATMPSRTMVLSGLLILFYVLFHLAHFTFRCTSPEIAALGPYDVYQMLVLGFSSPFVALTYIGAMVVLGLHLNHGVSSLFQSLGMNHSKYNGAIRLLGPLLGTALACGYIAIPVAVWTGFIRAVP